MGIARLLGREEEDSFIPRRFLGPVYDLLLFQHITPSQHHLLLGWYADVKPPFFFKMLMHISSSGMLERCEETIENTNCFVGRGHVLRGVPNGSSADCRSSSSDMM